MLNSKSGKSDTQFVLKPSLSQIFEEELVSVQDFSLLAQQALEITRYINSMLLVYEQG